VANQHGIVEESKEITVLSAILDEDDEESEVHEPEPEVEEPEDVRIGFVRKNVFGDDVYEQLFNEEEDAMCDESSWGS